MPILRFVKIFVDIQLSHYPIIPLSYYPILHHIILPAILLLFSFDHILNARRFSANIYREENIYGDRDVADYVRGNALFQVLESNKIKDFIRNKELDMWNY